MVMKAVPSTPAELEDMLQDPARVKSEFADPAKAKAFIESYRSAANKADPELGRQLEDAKQRGLAEFMAQNGIDPKKPTKRFPVGDGESGEGGVYKGLGLTPFERRQIAGTGKGPGCDLIGKFKSLGEFYAATHPSVIQRSGIDARLKALGEGAGDQGGFLVPEEYRAELMRLALEAAIVRPRARVIPMARETLRFPAIRSASHASTVYGGITAQWVPESGDISTANANSEPTFAQVRLDAKKLTGYTIATNELLSDSAIALEALIMALYPDAIAYFEDDAFISGSGAGEPVGILNADALISVSKETGQAAATVLWENIIKMYSRMLPQSLARAVWYANIDTFPQLALMSVNVGTGGAPVWINNGVSGPPASILGRPVVFTEKAETLGTAGDIVLADFSYYLIGDRQAMTVMSSPHVRFTTDETVWRFTHRVDGRPWIDTALTPRKSTATLSPFVALASRA